MLFNFQLSTPKEGLVDITAEVTEAIAESGVNEGYVSFTVRILPPLSLSMRTLILTLKQILYQVLTRVSLT